MGNKDHLTLKLIWMPKLVDRGGPIDLTLTLDKNKLIFFNLVPCAHNTYYGNFELNLLNTLMDFVKKSTIDRILLYSFREIESYLRVSNDIPISKNEKEGKLLIEDLKYFIVNELIYREFEGAFSGLEVLSNKTLVSAIKLIKTFVEEYNSYCYVGIFKQGIYLEAFSKGKLTFFIENDLGDLSLLLLKRIFMKKFCIKEIKLVARYSLTR